MSKWIELDKSRARNNIGVFRLDPSQAIATEFGPLVLSSSGKSPGIL